MERLPRRYSEELQRVLAWMLQITATERPTAQELLGAPQIAMRVRCAPRILAKFACLGRSQGKGMAKAQHHYSITEERNRGHHAENKA